MGFDELFGKSSPGSQKDEFTNANTRPKVNSSILGAVGQAFNQAKTHEFNSNNISSEKQAVINARAFQEKLSGNIRGIKAYSSEIAESLDPSDSSDNSSDSDETESSDSSITRVERVKNQVKTGLNLENSLQNSIEVDKKMEDQTSKKARAKVSANMIISDFSSLQLHSKHNKEQYENSSLTSPTSWIETSNESGRDNAVRRPRVKASTISEENVNFQYKKSNIVENQLRKVSFDSNSDATLRSEQTYARSDTRSDVSWGSDPGKLPYNTYNNNGNPISPKPKVRTNNSDYNSYLSQFQNDNYAHNISYQMNPSTSSNNKKSWSDVTYGESRTVVSHNSDPGPRRKISVSAQMSTNNDVEDYEEENTADVDQEELEELRSMSSSPKIQRKLLDLKIANKSLLNINSTLEETIKKQSSNLNTFESTTNVQQLQLDHITKVEELMHELSVKISSQELEIKSLKNKLDDNSEQQKKFTRVSLFYDPRNLPMNTLPSIIFDRVYEDFTILFSVVVSLIYTIYILPVIVTAKTAKLLADKSRAKILEITG